MALIPRVQCRRCGTEYSSLQSRCPKCGTRRMKQTQRAPGTTDGTVSGTAANEQAQANARWQMTFAAILVVAVILAMIVLITTSLNTEPGAKSTPTPNSPTPPAESISPSPSTEPTPTPTPTPEITSITIQHLGQEIQDFTAPSGDEVQLTAQVYPLFPEGEEPEIVWTSDNEEVCTVDQTGLVIGRGGSGKATVTATCGGKSATCIVYSR